MNKYYSKVGNYDSLFFVGYFFVKIRENLEEIRELEEGIKYENEIY